MHYAKVSKTIEHPKFGKIENVEFQVPQVDDLPELVQFYGSEGEVVSRNNRVIARSAPQSSILRLSKSEAANATEFAQAIEVEKGQTKNYKPEASGGMSKAAKAEVVDKITSLAAEDADKLKAMSKEEILAMLGVKLPTAVAA